MKTTHYPECWRDHHDCAVAVIERLLAKRVPMSRAEVDAMLDRLPKGAVCLDIVHAVEKHHGIE